MQLLEPAFLNESVCQILNSIIQITRKKKFQNKIKVDQANGKVLSREKGVVVLLEKFKAGRV